jgi:hypothetical protein
LSREFLAHPVLAHVVSNGILRYAQQTDLLVNGTAANRFANVRYELARNGYRYLVRHKGALGERRMAPAPWAEFSTQRLIETQFPGEQPIVDDATVSVYEIGPPLDESQLVPTIALHESWVNGLLHEGEGVRSAISPAKLYVASPVAQKAQLAITPKRIHDPLQGDIPRATVTLTVARAQQASGTLRPGETTTLPLDLGAGSQIVTLRIENPERVRDDASEPVRFTIGTIDLRLSHAGPAASADEKR